MNENNILSELIKKTNSRLGLDLKGKTVLTETANNFYAATACIPALAGAEVKAFSCNNEYSTAEGSFESVSRLSSILSVEENIDYVYDIGNIKDKSVDIVTNSFSLRPLKDNVLCKVRPGGVVLLMYEKWEQRETDADLQFCENNGISILPTDEHDDDFRLFGNVGLIAKKILLDNKIDAGKNSIAVIGQDDFAKTISGALMDIGASINEIVSDEDIKRSKGADVVIYCDYCNRIEIDWIEYSAYCRPEAYFIQFVGCKNISNVIDAGFHIIPARAVEFQHMAYTFDYIGPEPVVEILAASYKTAEKFFLDKEEK